MQNVCRLKKQSYYCNPKNHKIINPNFWFEGNSDFLFKMICMFYAKSNKMTLKFWIVIQKTEKMFDYCPNVPIFGQLNLDKRKIMFYNINRNNVLIDCFEQNCRTVILKQIYAVCLRMQRINIKSPTEKQG